MYVLYVQNRFHCKVKASGGITIIPLCVYVCVYVCASVCVCVCYCLGPALRPLGKVTRGGVCVCVYTDSYYMCTD